MKKHQTAALFLIAGLVSAAYSLSAPVALAQDKHVDVASVEKDGPKSLEELTWKQAISGRLVYLHTEPVLKSTLTGTLERDKRYLIGAIDDNWVAVRRDENSDVVGYASRDSFHDTERTDSWWILKLRLSKRLQDEDQFKGLSEKIREDMEEALVDTVNHLDRQYFEELNPGLLEELIDRSLELVEEEITKNGAAEIDYNLPARALLARLDAHSTYEDASRSKRTREELEGEFGGVGIEITRRDEGILVIAPIDDGPSVAAGIEAGDFIISVDGESVMEESLSESVRRIRGPLGEPVVLTIQRKDQPDFDVEIIRKTIRMRPAKARKVGDVCVLRLSGFSGNVSLMAETNLRALGDCRKTILDLRTNPGGLLNESIPIAGMFIGPKEVVSVKDRSQAKAVRAQNDALPIEKLVVLINGGSASASEIVSAAIMDQRPDAIIMGTQTFGKGSVQRLIPVAGEDYIRLTSALFYRPAGTTVQGVGVIPEIEIKPTKEDQDRFEKLKAEAIEKARAEGLDVSKIGERFTESSNFAAIQVPGQENQGAQSKELPADTCLNYVQEINPVTDKVDAGLSCALAILRDDPGVELQNLKTWAETR